MSTAVRKLNATEEHILSIQEKLDSWNSFVSELKIPAELYPAFASGRTQLTCLAKPRDMKADEVKVLYDLIGGLLKTNAALREHAQMIAQLAEQTKAGAWMFCKATDRLVEFANFRTPIDGDEE